MDLRGFLEKIAIWTIPALFAITLHEVAHGWTARFFGDRTAQMLGRLSVNPMRHIDPFGTVVIPGILLAIGGPPIGWAKPVPVVTSTLRHPRRALFCVALAGSLANFAMAAMWCGILAGMAHLKTGNATLVAWIELMAEAGMFVNVVLAVFNLIPVPPLDGGRVILGLLPPTWATQFARIEPFGLILVVGLAVLHGLDWLFEPALRVLGQVFTAVAGPT